MKFWMVALIESGPVRLTSISIRVVAWLVMLSAFVIWWGPGDASSDPVRALVGVLIAVILWVVATLPRWLSTWVRDAAGSR